MTTGIREMKKVDWPMVAEIYQQGIATNIATFQSECPAYEDWDKAHIAVCRLVITQDDEIAGWVALSPVSSHCGYAGVVEVSIYMAEAHRGRGLASQLLKELIAKSENQGFWTLESRIMQNNLASIRLHEKCGFRMVGYREKIGQDRFGNWRNTVLMERRSLIHK